MGAGPEEVWGIHTKWYRPGQNGKLKQPEPGSSKEWDSLVFSDFPQGGWELLRFGKVFGHSPVAGYDSSQRRQGWPFTVPRSRGSECPVDFQASNRSFLCEGDFQ